MAYHVKPPACEGCPAFTCGRSFVPSRGPKGAPVLLLGQGPGETEASLASPFVGPSGQKLGTWLRLAGIDQQRECRVGNVAMCWLPENREPTRAEVDHCRDAHWGVETAGRRIIIPIGVPAMRQFYPKAGESTAGQIIRLPDGTYCVGLLHPAFILRGNWALEPIQIQTLKLVRKILDGEEPHIYDFTKAPPGANLYPTLTDLHEWRAGLQPGDEVSVDIEAAGRVHVLHGLMRLRDLAHVTVRFRQKGGDVWPHPDWFGLAEWLYDFYADESIGKVLQNGFYDLEQLEEVGFEVNNFSYDTLLAMHIAYPELRKRLEAIALLCAGMTGWKSVLKEGEGHQK